MLLRRTVSLGSCNFTLVACIEKDTFDIADDPARGAKFTAIWKEASLLACQIASFLTRLNNARGIPIQVS
jgi:hypothetical protein